MNSPEMRWNGWGDPDQAVTLPSAVTDLLRDALGVRAPDRPAVGLDEVRLPSPALPAQVGDALAAAVGAANVRADHETRVRHTRGRSTPDLLRLRAGDAADAPDAVVYPASHDEVLEVLRVCTEARVAVVPYGGGTSVVGGLTPRRSGFAGVVALDLRRLDRLVALDEVSGTATLEPGLRGPQAERLLAARGHTLGHLPQSFEYATIGGFAATRSAGQASAGYGRFDDMVVGLRAATPAGTLDLGRAPASAAGPDLRQLLLGSEGAFGVVTSVTVRVRPVPEQQAYEGWRFESFTAGAQALRGLSQAGPVPAVLRLSDEAETAIGLARPDELGAAAPAGCLLVVGYAGSAVVVAAQRKLVGPALLAAGGQPLGADAGEAWARGRFHGPYLRDALLDAGALVETLETATFWSNLPRLYEAVRSVLSASLGGQGTPPLVLCHVSHLYPTGASLYFTVAAASTADPLAQWAEAKTTACDAIVAAGGTITHHHAVGTDHRRWLADEIGPLGVEVLRAVKDRLDPAGILNPGVLVE